MQSARDRVQQDGEDAQTFVRDVVRLARDADASVSDHEIASILERNIHPKYTTMYRIFGQFADKPQTVIKNLLKVMNPENEGVRKAFSNMMSRSQAEPAAGREDTVTTAAADALVTDHSPTPVRRAKNVRPVGESAAKALVAASQPNPYSNSGSLAWSSSFKSPRGGKRRNPQAGGYQQQQNKPYKRTYGRGDQVPGYQRNFLPSSSGLCFKCGKPGHVAAQCMDASQRQQQQLQQQSWIPANFDHLFPSSSAPPMTPPAPPYSYYPTPNLYIQASPFMSPPNSYYSPVMPPMADTPNFR